MVHQLPLELYPPATNAIRILAGREGWAVKVWSSENRRGLETAVVAGADLVRHAYPGLDGGSVGRLIGFLRWHWKVARDLARWQPEVVLSIEPHSALAVWFYYRFFGGKARLMIHHHEYYAPEDYLKAGNRTSRISHKTETADLFARAEWVSQTNGERLKLLLADLGTGPGGKWQTWPNYPPASWLSRAQTARAAARLRVNGAPLRLVYVGSLSFEDTFIREIVEWAAICPEEVTLHLCGHNVKDSVWDWVETCSAPNISCDRRGWDYDSQPERLADFDVALVLYKGNTRNFVFNVPNKVVEALVCGLEVWYPKEMEGMRLFRDEHWELPIHEFDFRNLSGGSQKLSGGRTFELSGFTAETAIQPLVFRLISPVAAPGIPMDDNA